MPAATRIEGLSVRDYAFRWAAGGCPIQQAHQGEPASPYKPEGPSHA